MTLTFLETFSLIYNVIPVIIDDRMKAMDIHKNNKDILDTLYLTGTSSVEVKYACIK